MAELERHHKREPLARGMLRETLREKVFAHSLPELFAGVIARLESAGKVVSEKDIIRSSQHRVGLSEQDEELSRRIEQLYLAAGVEAPSIDEAMTKAGVTAPQRAQARKILATQSRNTRSRGERCRFWAINANSADGEGG